MSELNMAPILPITSLAKDIKTVKRQADKSLVRITENGRSAYVFTSEKVFKELIARERADAAYEAYLLDSVGMGVADAKAGRGVASRAEMLTEAARRRAANGTRP